MSSKRSESDRDRVYAQSLQLAREAEIGTSVLVNGRTRAKLTAREWNGVTITYASGESTKADAKVWAQMGLVK